MDRVLPAVRDWRLHDLQRSREIEQQAQAVLPPHTLMRRAGVAAASLARAIAPHARQVWIACGPGNNGGDGLEAAIHLQASGAHVEVSLLGTSPGRQLPADAHAALERARAAGVSIGTSASPTAPPDLSIDALLGLGGNRAPAGEIEIAIRSLQGHDAPVLSIDLPSGLDGLTGVPHGAQAVRAAHTLCLLTLKPGLFTGRGRDHAGAVWLDTLSVDTSQGTPSAELIGAGSPAAKRRHAQHKGSFGDVAIVGGATGMQGAALLAARSALAAGAGRVFVELLGTPAPALDLQRLELMVRPGWSTSATPEALARATVVCGCGGGDAVTGVLPRLLDSAGQLVLDADALNAIARDPQLAALLESRRARRLESVITPHPLEASRLLGSDTARVQGDRLAAACELARRYRCVVVLKGSGTVIASPDEVPGINASGSAALATAGTGDVLAGWLGGAWAASDATALEVTRRAVWLHGRAAEHSPTTPILASDLVPAMQRIAG